MKHGELNKERPPQREQYKPKESKQNGSTIKQKANTEQPVNTAKEGSKF